MPGRKRLLLILAVVAALGLAVGVGVSYYVNTRARAPDIPGLLWPPPRRLAGFHLTDDRGVPFDAARLHGHWTVLFFGYTNCPDVCPTTLQAMADAARRLAAAGDGAKVQFVFVSIDPERDTLERIGTYVRYFDPDFVGVTGTEAALAKLTRQVGVLAVKGKPDAQGNYEVQHTAALIITDPQARFVGLLQPPHDPAVIAHTLVRMQRFEAG